MHGIEWGHMGGGTDWTGGIFMIVLWVAVIAAVVMLVVWLSRQTPSGTAQTGTVSYPAPPAASGDTPLEILAKRYARGEIDKGEYEAVKKDLGG
jgi:putative membrane protein